MSAGQYDTALRWHSLTEGDPDVYGQAEIVSTDQGVVWAVFPPPTSSRQDNIGSPTNTQYTQVRVREFVSIRSADTLTDLENDEVWEVVSVSRDTANYETICELKRLR